MKVLSNQDARRIALAAQGFAKRPAHVDVRHFRRAMKQMGVLQLDSVNVLCRSHFLPIFARLGSYDRDKLDDWLWRSGENVEFLAHAASLTPMASYPLLAHRLTLSRWKSGARFQKENADYLAAIRREIEQRGPLSVKDLDDAGERTGPWWGWSKGKIALEVMLRTGDLAIAERTSTFLTRYDLRERVIPDEVRAQKPRAPRRELLLRAAAHCGVGTDKDLADYFRLKVTECRPILRELVEDNALEEVQVDAWKERAYLVKGARAKPIAARALLSPFDPVVWFRPRAQRLFDFDYKIEIYVPAAKRKFGYYVLPFLLGDALVGRVDLKADRQSAQLVVKAAHVEKGRDKDAVAPELAKTLREMADWLGLDDVVVERRGALARALKAAF